MGQLFDQIQITQSPVQLGSRSTNPEKMQISKSLKHPDLSQKSFFFSFFNRTCNSQNAFLKKQDIQRSVRTFYAVARPNFDVKWQYME